MADRVSPRDPSNPLPPSLGKKKRSFFGRKIPQKEERLDQKIESPALSSHIIHASSLPKKKEKPIPPPKIGAKLPPPPKVIKTPPAKPLKAKPPVPAKIIGGETVSPARVVLDKKIRCFNELIERELSYQEQLEKLSILGQDYRANRPKYIDKIQFGQKKAQDVLDKFFDLVDRLRENSKKLTEIKSLSSNNDDEFKAAFHEFDQQFRELDFSAFVGYARIYSAISTVKNSAEMEKGKNLFLKEVNQFLGLDEQSDFFINAIITPIQRIAKYQLILKELLQSEVDPHQKKSIEATQQFAAKEASKANKGI